jgi:hypothetical protein
LFSNKTGNRNTAIGQNALSSNISGSFNTAVGVNSLDSLVTGSFNIAIGNSSLNSTRTGSYNLALGNGAGIQTTSGSNTNTNYSIFIGDNTRANLPGETNQIVIGYDALGLGSNTVVLGNDNITKTALKGNVTISNVLTLEPQHPLPTNPRTGSFAVSSSVPPKPYFYNGTTWTALY